jgi:hypothetical protein
MAQSCRRLLAAFFLLLVAAFLRAQVDTNPREVPLANEALSSGPVEFTPAQPLPVAGSSRGYSPPVFGAIGLPQIVQQAGIIFAGTVESIARGPSAKGPASTAITFKVETALRGVKPGQELTIHEWAGLQCRGERYRVGEHVFLFLYPLSRLGLTSPVAGPIGRVAVKPTGEIVLTPQHIQLLVTDPILSGRTYITSMDFAMAIQRFANKE